jgi:DNA-binding MarR family transcriptional regulator
LTIVDNVILANYNVDNININLSPELGSSELWSGRGSVQTIPSALTSALKIELFQAVDSVENVYMTRLNVAHVKKKTGPLADDIFASIHTIMHLFRAEQYRVLRKGGYDLTHMEGKILGFFIRHPGETLRDLVAHLKQDKGQLARLIRSLKDQGLLETQAGARDRRSVPLHATREGRRIHQILQRQVRRLSELAVKGLDPEERYQLVTLLDEVQSNLERVRDASSNARRSA